MKLCEYKGCDTQLSEHNKGIYCYPHKRARVADKANKGLKMPCARHKRKENQ